MGKTYKLVVSDRVEFDVRFTLNDAGKDKHFGMRLSANRQPLDEQERALSDGTKFKAFLEERGVQMVSWILDKDCHEAPLKGEDGKHLEAGAEALEALYVLVGGMVSLVFTAYLQANGAKGRSGN